MTRTFSVRVAVPDADASLSWGMTANVAVAAPRRMRARTVPLTSIYHEHEGKPAVWVYDPAREQGDLRAVELGPFREDGVVMTRGLSHGEWIVAAGVHKLEPGQMVKPYEAPGNRLVRAPSTSRASKRSRGAASTARAGDRR